MRPLSLPSLSLAALLLAAGAAHASITVYQSEATFLAAVVAPGLDSFDDLYGFAAFATPLARAAGAYGYSASVGPTSSFFGAGSGGDGWLSSDDRFDTITLSNFSGGVRAIGANFFGSDYFGQFASGATVTLTATDGGGSVTQTIASSDLSSFRGFVSNGALSSLTLKLGDQPGFWPTANNLTLASAPLAPVPEPASYAMLLAGLSTVAALARRRKSRGVSANPVGSESN